MAMVPFLLMVALVVVGIWRSECKSYFLIISPAGLSLSIFINHSFLNNTECKIRRKWRHSGKITKLSCCHCTAQSPLGLKIQFCAQLTGQQTESDTPPCLPSEEEEVEVQQQEEEEERLCKSCREQCFFALIKIIREVSKQEENFSNIEDSTVRRCAGWRNTEVAPADWLHNFGLPLPLSVPRSPCQEHY